MSALHLRRIGSFVQAEMLEQRSHELLVIRIDGLQRENAALRLHNQRLVAESERTTSERVALTELLQVGALRLWCICMHEPSSVCDDKG